MDCLKIKCNYYSPDNSALHACDYCTISDSCASDGCPIDRMTRYAEDWLAGLKSIQKYLATLK